MKIILPILATFLFILKVEAQQPMTLQEAIELAQKQSYDALIAENEYMAAYWNYRNFQTSILPTIDISARPTTFNRAITKQFNPIDTAYNYFEERILNSYVNLSLNQPLPFSGGTVYVDSDIGRLENFGERANQQYSATAVRIGLQQPLFGFNQYKWEKRLQPLKYSIEQRELIQNQEDIALRTIQLFFSCARAKLNQNIAEINLANADSLYSIGERRYAITAITKNELLTLRLEVVNSQNNVKQSSNLYDRALARLVAFLGMEANEMPVLGIPEILPQFNVEGDEVFVKAKENNPDYLNLDYQRVEADRNEEKAKIDARFKMNLSASYGLNQRSKEITNLYDDMLNQERLDLSVNIPIVDWGERKNRYNLALRQKEAQVFAIAQREMTLEQDILMTASEFNLQDELVASAREAASIADEVYETSLNRFILGEIGVNDLFIQLNRRESAQRSYLSELERYWSLYYQLRSISLWDWESNAPISINREIME